SPSVPISGSPCCATRFLPLAPCSHACPDFRIWGSSAYRYPDVPDKSQNRRPKAACQKADSSRNDDSPLRIPAAGCDPSAYLFQDQFRDWELLRSGPPGSSTLTWFLSSRILYGTQPLCSLTPFPLDHPFFGQGHL